MKPSLLGIATGISALFMAFSLPTFEQRASAKPVFESTKLLPNVLTQNSTAVNEIAKNTTPAVVSITAVKSVSHRSGALNYPSLDSDQTTMGIGSGVVIRSNGIILTNYHLVENSDRVTVAFDEKQKYSAHTLGGDPKTDLAVIQLDQPPKQKLPTLAFGDSDAIHVGDWALAVGSPFGLSHSVTSGIISAVGRGRLGMLDIEDFIQTDAAINPGNSGGPLLNSKGEMIGINTAIFSQTGGFIGIGFSIPSKIAKQVFEELLDHGRVIRGWIGLSAQDLDKDLASYFGTPTVEGALVSHVEAGGPASQASIQTGDVITRFSQKKILSADQLKALVASVKTPRRIPIELFRNGKMHSLSIFIREQPSPKPALMQQQAGRAPIKLQPQSSADLGLTLQDVPDEFIDLLRIPVRSGALVMDVRVGSLAFEAGMSRGDIILKLNKAIIRGAKDFERSLKSMAPSDLTVLYIQRGPEEKLFIPVRTN